MKADAGGELLFEVKAARGTSQAVVAVVSPSGATYFRRAKVAGLASEELEKSLRDLYPADAAAR